MCDSRTKKLTHTPGKILLKKHVNLEKGQKIYFFFLLLFFSPVKIRSTLFFCSFNFIFHIIPALVEFPAPRQLSKIKSRPPGKFFELILRGCPGGCTQLELTETLHDYLVRSKIKAGTTEQTSIITHLAGQMYVWHGCKWNFAGPQIYLQPAKIKSQHFGVSLKFLVFN